jgi:hypothetical protein
LNLSRVLTWGCRGAYSSGGFKPTSNSRQIDYLDFGCCRVEIPKENGQQ